MIPLKSVINEVSRSLQLRLPKASDGALAQ